MRLRRYVVQSQKRQDLIRQLESAIDNHAAVTFAYLYGSFLDADVVHDIDVGIYLQESAASERATVSMVLEKKLTETAGVPVDVRVLNGAPFSFLFHVLRGRLLICRDELLLTTILEHVARRYLDLAPLLRRSARDAFAA
jgi:predicted nucleotidyltransferase